MVVIYGKAEPTLMKPCPDIRHAKTCPDPLTEPWDGITHCRFLSTLTHQGRMSGQVSSNKFPVQILPRRSSWRSENGNTLCEILCRLLLGNDGIPAPSCNDGCALDGGLRRLDLHRACNRAWKMALKADRDRIPVRRWNSSDNPLNKESNEVISTGAC